MKEYLLNRVEHIETKGVIETFSEREVQVYYIVVN